MGADMDVLSLKWRLAWARVLLWIASVGREAEPTPEVHWYLADLHFRLCDAYERVGKRKLAREHKAIANRHAAKGPPPDLPPAVAMAMAADPPDDAA
jgi:hypothetical protein